jgi:hypothetical protein
LEGIYFLFHECGKEKDRTNIGKSLLEPVCERKIRRGGTYKGH